MKKLFQFPNQHEHRQGPFSTGKTLSSLFWSCITVLVSATSVFPQQTATLPEVTITSNAVHVNEKVLKVFERSFKGAENPRWFQLGKKYMVKYTMDEMLHKTIFGKKGGFIYDIGYGFGENLPLNIRSQVDGSYENYNITNIANVKINNRDLWKINIENDKHIILVHAEDGRMIEEDRMDKSTATSPSYGFMRSIEKTLTE